MQQGHQERLAPLIAEVMAEAGVGFDRIDRIGVTVGPGSFTGLRVGLSFAKGLGLALNRPVIGIDSLIAIAASARREGPGLVLIDARRGQVYERRFDGASSTSPSRAVALEEVFAGLPPGWIAGPGAILLADRFGEAILDDRQAGDPVTLARLAASADPAACLPEPIYLRAPDAKLPGGIDP